MRFFNCVICSSPKLVDNARLKDIRQTTGLKTAVKGTAIICSSISQCIKTRLNAIFILTGINTVYSYRRLFAGIYFPQSQQKANYLGSYWSSVIKMNVSKLSKSLNIKLSFIFWRIGDIYNKFAKLYESLTIQFSPKFFNIKLKIHHDI